MIEGLSVEGQAVEFGNTIRPYGQAGSGLVKPLNKSKSLTTKLNGFIGREKACFRPPPSHSSTVHLNVRFKSGQDRREWGVKQAFYALSNRLYQKNQFSAIR